MSRCRMPPAATLLLASALALSALAGCWSQVPGDAGARLSQDGSRTPAGATTPQPGGVEVGKTPEAAPKPAPQDRAAVVQGVLRLPGAEPLSLDPALAQDVSSWGYLLQIFSGLVALDSELQVVAEIARDWKTDDSGTVYTFNLRQDAKFHDGRPVTAADFKYSFERAADPSLGSPVADTYLGDIVGVKDKLAGKEAEISGLKVIGEHTIEITIDAAKPYFLAKLTYPTAYVVDRKNVEQGKNWWQRPNGSGPFKMKSWLNDEEIVLEANDQYYGAKPKIAEVSYFLDAGSSMAMYERDELDLANVGPADVGRVTDENNPLNRELLVVPQLNIWYIGFNSKTAPFDDPKVRLAFNLAADKQRIVDVLLRKTRVRADGILPPGMPGYNEELRPLPFDPGKAKQLLAESSYGGAENLPPITLTVGAGGGGLGQSFAEMYERNLGVRISVEQADRGFFEDLNAQSYQMFYLGWVADYPDPQDFLDVLFHSGSAGNHMGYANRDVDGLLERARVERDPKARWELYHQAEQQIVDDGAWVPLFHDVDYVLVKPRVKGLTWTAMGLLSLKEVTVEPRVRPGTL